MSQSFDMIGAIDNSKETFKPRVWIVDLWFEQVVKSLATLKWF